MSDHKHGEMDIEVQKKTFDRFISMVAKTSVFIIVALILLAMING